MTDAFYVLQIFLFISIHFYSFLFISIHFYSFLFISIHFYSFLFISIHFYSFLFISIHFYSFLFISIHFYSFLFISIHFYSFLSSHADQSCKINCRPIYDAICAKFVPELCMAVLSVLHFCWKHFLPQFFRGLALIPFSIGKIR